MSKDKKINDAQFASSVLHDVVFIDAVEAVKNGIIAEWRNSKTAQERETLFISEKMLARVLTELERFVAEGQIESANLKRDRNPNWLGK